MRNVLAQAAGRPTPDALAGFAKQPGPARQQSLINLLGRMVEEIESDYPAVRTIPPDKIIEVSVSVRLPGGGNVGPYRMYGSLGQGHTAYEYATGQSFAISDRLPIGPGKVPTLKDIAGANMTFFDADGDERFIGAVLASVGPKESIAMSFALIVDGQPMRIVGAAERSGASVQIVAPGGYLFTIKPALRPRSPIEARWHELAKQQIASKANSATNAAPMRRINPEWPGPAYFRTGPLFLDVFAGSRFVCDQWRSKFSNDPAVDVRKMGATAATLTFDSQGKPNISATLPAGAFATDVFPAGIAADQFADSQNWPTSVRHLGRSPTLADVLEFSDLEQPSSSLTWDRIRREAGIIYRTRFFVRCRKER